MMAKDTNPNPFSGRYICSICGARTDCKTAGIERFSVIFLAQIEKAIANQCCPICNTPEDYWSERSPIYRWSKN